LRLARRMAISQNTYDSRRRVVMNIRCGGGMRLCRSWKDRRRAGSRYAEHARRVVDRRVVVGWVGTRLGAGRANDERTGGKRTLRRCGMARQDPNQHRLEHNSVARGHGDPRPRALSNRTGTPHGSDTTEICDAGKCRSWHQMVGGPNAVRLRAHWLRLDSAENGGSDAISFPLCGGTHIHVRHSGFGHADDGRKRQPPAGRPRIAVTEPVARRATL
jgi:hypothetical protein